MKKILLLLLLPAFVFAGEVKPKSTIKEVTVYLTGAQVTSESAVSLPKGVTEIYLTGLSPLIDANSIQVSGLKDVSILSINYTVNSIAKQADSEKMKVLEANLAAKRRELALLQNTISGLQEEEVLLKTNNKINNAQSLTMAQITTFSKYYRERVAELKTDIYDTNVKIGKLNQEINDINTEFNKLQYSSREQRGEILVKVDAPAAAVLTLTTKYNVSDAGWFPIYDIKTEGVKQPLSIHYKAHVYQQTGEDWDNVKVTLSTGDPTVNSTKPEVLPHYLNFTGGYTAAVTPTPTYAYKYNPNIRTVTGTVTDNTGLPLPGVNIIEQGTNNGATTDMEGRYTIKINTGQQLLYSFIGFTNQVLPVYAQQMNVRLEEDTATLDEVVVEAYSTGRKSKNSDKAAAAVTEQELTATGDVKEQGVTNAVFKITKPYSILSSQEVTVIAIDQFNLPAEYEYFTAPLLNQNVFLTAKVKDWEQYDILPGEANVYFEGNYAGKTYLDPLQTTEELVVSLGVDPSVIVERKQIDNLKSKSFLGGTRIIDKNYEIAVRNNKATEINLVMMDRIPVSQNKEIKVEEVKTGDAAYEDKKGLLTWKLTLAGKTSVKEQFSYQVKYPKEKRVNL